MSKSSGNVFYGYDSLFAKQLRTLIQEHKVTQQKLSIEIETSKQAISQYCDGSTIPNSAKLLKIAQFFNVSVDYLLGLSEAPTNDKEIASISDYTGLSVKSIEVLHELNIYHKRQMKTFKYATDNVTKKGLINELLINEHTPLETAHKYLINLAFCVDVYENLSKEYDIHACSDSELCEIADDLDDISKGWRLSYFEAVEKYKDFLKDLTIDNIQKVESFEKQVNSEYNKRFYENIDYQSIK